MKKKYGPLPLWAWVVIVGGAIGAYLLYKQNSSSSSTSGSTVDPNNPLGLTYSQEQADQAAGIDPNTGQTFASESTLGATGALPGDAGSSGSAAGTGTTTTDATTQTELADISAQLQGLTDAQSPAQTFSGEIGDVTSGITALQALQAALTPPAAAAAGAAGASLPSLGKGAIRAPSGPKKPPAKKGYTIRGLGSGNWEYVPTKQTHANAAAGSGKVGGTVDRFTPGTATARRTTTHTSKPKTTKKTHKPPARRVVRGRR